MNANRFTFSAAPTAPQRRSRADGKSFIPKPRQGSYERLSEAGWRGPRPRSNSMEPPRATIGAGRHSREPSATKPPLPHQRSRSQQSEGWPQMTPLNKAKALSRGTTTPMRTPSTDRSARSWQNSLERALAFVTVKDKRQIANPKWQKTTATCVNAELERRGGVGAPGAALMRPLTITRFVDITAGLLSQLQEKVRLDSTNYVTKLPHITKRLLYPGVVSKSWLKTVNTLHTYPSALALIAYLNDLVLRVESPVDEEMLYAERDELSCLRRQYLLDCWCCYNQESCKQEDFNALDEEYLAGLRRLLGDDDERMARLKEIIEESRLELEDPSEQAARADEQRRLEALNQLSEALREQKARRIQDRGRMDTGCSQQTALLDATRQLQVENERAQAELQQLKLEVATQPLSPAERALLLDKVDYSNRVIDSKNDLIQQVLRMVQKTETELAVAQTQCLAACVEYNQRVIAVGSAHADCAGLAVEESDLMQESTVEAVAGAVEALRSKHARVADALKGAERGRLASMRRLSQQNYQLEQVTVRLSEAQEHLESERVALRKEREAAAAARDASARELRELASRARHHDTTAAELASADVELARWERQDSEWSRRLQEMREYVSEQEQAAPRRLAECKQTRTRLWREHARALTERVREIVQQHRGK